MSRMKRNAIQELVAWKSSEDRKPMVLKGARQVGKTWLMKEFGQNYYDSYVYFNFDEEDELKSIFEVNKNPQRIIELLSLITGEKILPEKTLIIFDEIQECPEALNTLKYFKEKANEYHVIAAGSLLGTLLAQPKSYPVGMVNLLDIYPLTFDEFLEATDESLYAYYSSIQKEQPIEEIFHNRLLEAYNYYLIIGGMPAAIMEYKKEKKLLLVPDTQQKLLNLFLSDITALAPKGTARHCRNAWLSIPAQLGRTSRKFQYTRIAKGATAKVYHEPLQWLISAGLAIPCQTAVCSKLSENSLHLYPVDTGLCSCILKIPAFHLLSGEETTAGTACIETFLAQHFIRNGYALSYWSSGNQAEVPFLLSKNSHFIAIDYRTTPHQKCRNLMQLNKSSLSPAPTQMYLISAEDFRQKEAYRIVPLYAVFCI